MASLTNRNALVYGVERPLGRKCAVALAEAGADVAVVTLTEETAAEFTANSTANEFWAIGRRGIALTSDGGETAFREAITDAASELGPISILLYHASQPLPREALAGLRSDPAIVVLLESDASVDEARELLQWTRDLADAGLRANAIAPTRSLAEAIAPLLKEHHPTEPLTVADAAVYLASDASAAVEGTLLVAVET